MDKKEIIAKTFPFLEKKLIDEIEAHSVMQQLSPGKSIIGEGQYIKSFPMVLQGCLRVSRLSESGNELLLYFLKSGEICCMALTCCMSMQKSNVRLTAEEESLIAAVPVEAPERWMSEYKSWKEFMMYSYKHRFDELLDTIDSIAFTRLDERLVRFFRERYESTGRTLFEGTHQDIALQLNTSREVISRLLKSLENGGRIMTGRNMIDYSGLFQTE